MLFSKAFVFTLPMHCFTIERCNQADAAQRSMGLVSGALQTHQHRFFLTIATQLVDVLNVVHIPQEQPLKTQAQSSADKAGVSHLGDTANDALPNFSN